MNVAPTIDRDKDFASYYLPRGGDPDMTCERLYRWRPALWSRVVPGVVPCRLEVAKH